MNNSAMKRSALGSSAMKAQQRGFLLIEALVAILIFSLGVLGMVAMGSAAVTTQSDSRYRTDAAALADEIAGTIAFSVARGTTGLPAVVNAATLSNSVATFAYQDVTTGLLGDCVFAGGGTVDPVVQTWISNSVEAGPRQLPKAREQIVVTNGAGLNRVQITLCWQGPNDIAIRHHTLVTYIN